LAVLDDTAQSLFADVDNDGDQDLVLATGTRPLLFVNDGRGRFTPVPDAFRFERPLQGVLTSIAIADYDRDGFLDLYLCVYSYFFGAGEDKARTPMPYHDARNGPPGVLFHNDGRGRFVDATRETNLDQANDRYHFAAAWADYDGDGWLDLLVANDFGAKNLYRNRGPQGGRVTFEDVAERAGVLDHGAGMSATSFDYDNDGLLDIYTGNMWSASGQRVTSSSSFMPDAPADVRALYRRHVRGNSLFRNAATAASTTGRSRRARRWDAGPGRRTHWTSTATDGRTSTSSTGCSRVMTAPTTWKASSGVKSLRGRPSRLSRARRMTMPGAPSISC
jgi:FG-GAP-like repeat